MAAKANALGDFLRARRDQVRPEDVGLVPGGQRRAPGLRREELAMLAGISAEYYLRLERGAPNIPPPRSLMRSRGRYSWTAKPRVTYMTWPPRMKGILPSRKWRPTDWPKSSMSC